MDRFFRNGCRNRLAFVCMMRIFWIFVNNSTDYTPFQAGRRVKNVAFGGGTVMMARYLVSIHKWPIYPISVLCAT